MPKFDLDQMIDLMQRPRALWACRPSTRSSWGTRFDKDLTSHMRLFVSGSAPLLAETHVQFQERTGHRILERYGMTETNMNTSNPYEGDRRAGTVGFPLPDVELKIWIPKRAQHCLMVRSVFWKYVAPMSFRAIGRC